MRRSRPLLMVIVVLATTVLLPVHGARAAAAPVNLGLAAPFAVLGGSTVTNAGNTMANGDVGVHPGTAVTITPDMVNGAIHAGNDVAKEAKADLATAYESALLQTPYAPLAGSLGGMKLTPGLYSFAVAATLGGTLTLDGGGDQDAAFIIQIGSTITTAANSAVVLTGSAQVCRVTWLIGSSATLGANTSFRGDLLAHTSITAGGGTTVDGRLLAMGGAVTLDTNTVTATTCLPPVTMTSTTTSTTGVQHLPGAGRRLCEPRHYRRGPDHDGHPGLLLGQRPERHRRRLLRDRPCDQVHQRGPTHARRRLALHVRARRHPLVADGRPYAIDGGSPVSIVAAAAAGSGMGTYLFGATTLTLALPADVYADTYASIITISVVSAP